MQDNAFMLFGKDPKNLTLEVPYPTINSAVFEKQAQYEFTTTASNRVVAQKKGRATETQGVGWTFIKPEPWWAINRWLEENGPFFYCKYFSFATGEWLIRRFYCTGSTGEPVNVDVETMVPQHIQNAKLYLLDAGAE